MIVIPVGLTAKTTEEDRKKLLDKAGELAHALRLEGKIATETDLRENVSPGWKFNHWELKGYLLSEGTSSKAF